MKIQNEFVQLATPIFGCSASGIDTKLGIRCAAKPGGFVSGVLAEIAIEAKKSD